ncbi:alpha/beta fold hydrolase [Bacillus sp. AK128]
MNYGFGLSIVKDNYKAPTLVITGEKDVFFPASKISKVANNIIPNLTACKIYDMGHFPSEGDLVVIYNEIQDFLKEHY